MIKSFLFAIASLPLLLVASPLTLKEKLAEAVPNSYLVTLQSRNYTFLHIFENKGERLILEEVTIPEENFSALKMGWKEWFERGAPGHTSWMLSKVNLTTGAIDEIYSCTQEGWVDTHSYTGFMATLLNLNFHLVADCERKRIGLPPGYGKADLRPFWSPRLVVDGTAQSPTAFKAWKTKWPSDGSEMAHKTIEVYLPAEPSQNFPTYFPYWLEVEGKIGSAKIRVVDSGMHAKSVRSHFPQRKPLLLHHGKWEEDCYVIELKNPSHLTDFLVMAEEADSPLCKSYAIPVTSVQTGNVTKLLLNKKDLTEHLDPNQNYHFVITTQQGPFALLETKPFSLSNK